MPDDPQSNDLDRRHFMASAIGVSAALATDINAARAQAPIASRGTVYTGDVIDGKKVVSALNLEDLEPGKKHLFYFRATGQTRRAGQRRARRRDQHGSYDTDRHERP